MYVYTYVLYLCSTFIIITILMFKYSEEVFSPEELLAMIFNSSRQAAQDYAGTFKTVYLVDECLVKNLY